MSDAKFVFGEVDVYGKRAGSDVAFNFKRVLSVGSGHGAAFHYLKWVPLTEGVAPHDRYEVTLSRERLQEFADFIAKLLEE